MEDANRLLRYKNFNHINKDQEGGMEIFGTRVADEITQLNDMINDEIDDTTETNDEVEEIGDDISYPGDEKQEFDNSLNINIEPTIPYRFHSYPYGFQNTPMPTYKENPSIAPKVLTFEQFLYEHHII